MKKVINKINLDIYPLIHFIGDVHQPLHITTLFSNEFPAPIGDRGGNNYKIKGEQQENLHMFWDSGAGMWQDELDRPLNNPAKQWLNNWADKITLNYPKNSFNHLFNETNPYQWAVENYQYAVDDVYNSIKTNTIPTDQYVARAREICMRLVALAGYRLANTLNSLLLV